MYLLMVLNMIRIFRKDFKLKILAIDTASEICGVSILDNRTLIKQFDISANQSHSTLLLPTIKNLFDSLNFNLKDIDLLVCNIGPRVFYRY